MIVYFTVFVYIGIAGIIVGHFLKDFLYCFYQIKIDSFLILEGINGILYSIIFIVNGRNTVSIIYCLMESALLLIAIIDGYTYEIPFSINIFLGILGIIATMLDRGQEINHLIGAFFISGILFFLYYMTRGTAIGGGDIKLMAACGLLLGWKKITIAFIIGCMSGLLIHSIRMKRKNLSHIFAMGPYLAVGIYLAAIWGEKWMIAFPFFFPF